MSDFTLPTEESLAEYIARMPPADRAQIISALRDPDLPTFDINWMFWSRKAQAAPPGDWRIWLILAGRGFGKTRAGAEWVRALAEADGRLRIALVAATAAEGRAVMIEGESGLLAIAPRGLRPVYEPSLRRLRWPNGAQALLYSAAEPESLRGAQHHHAWADEIAKWAEGEAVWANLNLGLRLGERPRIVATTTPRPVPLLRTLIADPGVAVTRGRTDDNRAHLPPAFIAAMHDAYGGTRLGRQELDGELIEEVEGALWTRALIERCRARSYPPPRRVVVGVDPPAGIGGDACGIVAVAIGDDGIAYVIEDASVAGAGPEGWAMIGHAAGDRFTVVDAATLLPFDAPIGALGGTARVLASGVGDSAAVAADAALRGQALRPPRPVHLAAARLADGTIRIAWVRRSRISWSWLDGGDAPLGEESERYRLTITSAVGSVRTVEPVAPTYDYTAAEQAADGAGSALSIDVAIVQLGALAASQPAATGHFSV